MANGPSRLRRLLGIAYHQGLIVLDQTLPAEKRAEILEKTKGFATENPKLAAFLAVQAVFTGIPIVLFLAFTLTVFVFSLIVALILGAIAASLFTLLMAGIALLVLLPTIFFTTFAASFFSAWGLAGYYVLQWVTKRTQSPDHGQRNGRMIGDASGPNSFHKNLSYLMRNDDTSASVFQRVKQEANEALLKKDGSEKEDNEKIQGTRGTQKPSNPTPNTTVAPVQLSSPPDAPEKEMLEEMKRSGNPYGVLGATGAPPPY